MRIRSESMIVISLSMFLMLSASILTLPKVAADDYVDSASVSISASCSMSGTGLVHSAEVNNGQTVYDIGLTNIKVFCNDRLGFAIYAIGYTDDTYGKTVLSNSALGSSFDIETSATIVDATSSWAMKLAAVSGTYAPIIAGSSADTEQGGPDFSNYAAIPEEYTKVAYYGSNTDTGTSAAGSNISVTYRAHVSRFQPAGTYVGQVKYTVVHPNIASAPSLYCNPDGTTITTIGCMQDLNANNKASVLASMTEDQQYTLRDSRDDKVYYVSKLRDGNIWMTQNLDFDIDSSKTYTSSDTDLPNGVTWTPDRSTLEEDELDSWSVDHENDWNLLQSYDGGDLYYDTSGIQVASDIQSYVASCMNGTCDEDIYDQLPSEWQDYIDTCDANFSNCDDSLLPEMNMVPSLSDNGDPHRHVGNLYNFTAAVAMNDDIIDVASSSEVNEFERSICPAGWRLPVYSDWNSEDPLNGSLLYLFLQYDYGEEESLYLSNAYNEPLYLAPAGIIEDNGNDEAELIFNDGGPGFIYSSSRLKYANEGFNSALTGWWSDGIITAFDLDTIHDENGLYALPGSVLFPSPTLIGGSVRCVAR